MTTPTPTSASASARVKQFKTEEERQKILERIRNILSLAKGTSFEGEADTAMKLALDYMKRYGLSLSEVEVKEELKEEIVSEPLNRKVKTQELWERHMCMAIASVFDCETYFDTRCRDTSSRISSVMVFCGFPKDVDMCKLLFNILLVSAKSAAHKKYPSDYQKIRSFLLGFGIGLTRRVREEKERIKENIPNTNNSYALMVVEKQLAITNWLHAKVKLTSTRPSRSRPNSEAFASGEHHARSVDLLDKEKMNSNQPRPPQQQRQSQSQLAIS